MKTLVLILAIALSFVAEAADTRLVSVGGRTVISNFNGPDNSRVPLPGVTVVAVVNGKVLKVVSDPMGFWALSGIPTRWSGSSQDPTNNITIYFSLLGFNSISRSINLIDLASAPSEVPSAAYQIDVGEIEIEQQPLEFSSNIIRVWNNGGINTAWVGSYAIVGTSEFDAENVYLPSTSSAISLTFNFPVDTVRAGTKFLWLKSPANINIPYTGVWNSTGTVFTITPNAPLVPSQFKNDKYSFRFIGPIWTQGAIYQQVALSNTSVFFNVMSASSAMPITSQAPMFAPEADSTANVLSYSFGHNTVLMNGLVATGGLTDIIASGTGIALRYNTNPGTTNRVYSRYVPKSGFGPVSAWTDRSASCTSATYADSTATCLLANIYSYTSNGSSLLNGEQLQFVVTSIKNGEESHPDAIDPLLLLTISDKQKPFLVTPTAWNAVTSVATRPEWATNIVTGRMTVTFSKNMSSAAPNFSSLSGGLVSVAPNSGTGRWSSLTQYKQNMTLTFSVPTTTLSQSHNIGQTRIKVTSLGTSSSNFTVGDKVIIGPNSGPNNNSQYREQKIISAIDTYNDVITLSAGLSVPHSSGDAVMLLESSISNPGLTFFKSTVTTAKRAGSYYLQLAAGTGANFYPGQSLKIYRIDPTGTNGYLPAVSATIASISSDLVTLTAPLSAGISAGSLVMDSGVVAAEPLPRAAVALTSTDKVMFDSSNTATTTISNDQFSTIPDATLSSIDVASTEGIFVGDVVELAASSASSNLATGSSVTSVSTVINVTAGHGQKFRAGDLIEISGKTVVLTIANNSPSTINAAGTTLRLSSAQDIRIGDTIRFSEAAAKTNISAEVSSVIAVAQTLSVDSTSGFAAGQTVTYDDRIYAPVSVSITSIENATQMKVSGLTAGRRAPFGAVIYKVAMAEDVFPTANTSTNTPTVTFSATNGYSPQASVTLIRPNRRQTVASISNDSLTLSGAIGGGYLDTNLPIVSLVSENEQFVVTNIQNNYSLVLSGNIQFPHRAGAFLTKASQASFIVSAGQLNTVMVGDTIAFEQNTSGNTFARLDRFYGTVSALDTATGQVTVSTSQNGYYDFSALGSESIKAMGDAVTVTGAIDTSSNAMDPLYGCRMDIVGTSVSLYNP